ncbi:hypothetical protein UFOVP117_39 [uncultured Caudovirales phage]|uniref:Uncharacterized protein n=1 Tax=uncultured Caudovirales phage TaxID=2100421 RepID=A0A6J5L837_9CAUD|nr:hypothetical protein UFOVP117_39 [uncultured Caudovirales phage]
MADNIHIENDYQNIFVVDPNKVDLPNGQVSDRNIAQEELVMYANLECNLQARSKLIVGTGDKQLRTLGLGKINFLKPTGEDYLSTKWTELQSQSRKANEINGELLGITQISYKVTQPYVAQFTVNLEDVRGRALFESGNDSIYSAFFNLPYPVFYLTLKGWYGKAIRYQLLLSKFHGAFNSSTGNFEITLTFTSFTFSVLKDLFMTDLYAVPQMYQTTKIDNSNNGVVVDNNVTQNFSTSTTFLGNDKIIEVYKKYKSKGLLPQDFPELTVQSLIEKLETFINTSLESLGQVSLNPLTDYEKYLKTLDELNSEIVLYAEESWFNKWLNLEKLFVVKEGTGNINVYTYLLDASLGDAYTDLKTKIESKITILNKNVTFGDSGGLYSIPLKIDDILNSLKPNISKSDFDYEKTILKRYGGTTVTQQQIDDLGVEIQELVFKNQKNPFIFTNQGKNGFTNYIQKIKTKLNSYKEELEISLSDQLSEILKSPSGIGFQPTIRNIIGVLMASAEAYLLLLEDVHTKAFNQRENPKRQQSIGGFDKKENQINPIVYPWPQYVVGKIIDGVEKFEIQYPGDPNYIYQTGGDDYEAWPEVEFVEEYTKSFILRQIPPNTAQSQQNTNVILRNLISGFDTIPSNISYSNLSVPDFFFEIMERLQLIVTLNGFSGDLGFNNILPFLSQTEFENMKEALKNDNGGITNILKNGKYRTVTSFNELLSSFSVSYAKYSNGFLTVPYLINEFNNSFKILDKDLPEQSVLVLEKTIKLVKDTIKNSTYTNNSLDIYPFIDLNWCKNNLENGSILTKDIVYSTKSSLFYNDFNKKIANYDINDAIGISGYNSSLPNLPLVNLKIKSNIIDTETLNLNTFYTNREVKDYVFTEGKITCTNSQFTQSQTTSILNTPYFINAIQEGIENERNDSDHPYISASYLFLNSLPLTTTKERYTLNDVANSVKNNFISTTLKKYSGIHALPLPWIAKLGSIWYRYKNWKENGVDILSNIWNNFDYANNYDPVNGQVNTPYIIQNNTIVLQQDASSSQGFTLGFYPKLINDFYYLVNGVNLFSSTDTTINIQNKINDAIISKNIWILDGSGTTIGDDIITTPGNTKSVRINTISVLVKDIQNDKYVITPSFGLYDTIPSSTNNQLIAEIINYSSGSGFTRTSLVNNSSMYNGSVRLLWGGPNYGYFDTTQFTINPPDKYFKKIYTGSTDTQTSFELFGEDEYSSIEEIFSIFSKDELDSLENIFLNYTKSIQKNTQKEKFHNVLKGILSTNYLPENITIADMLSIQSAQMYTLIDVLNTHIGYNKLISIGNPKKYDKRIFSSVSSNPLLNTTPPGGYINNSLPTSGGTTTLSNSKLLYPEAWKALELYVGFSTIPELDYSDNGSFITDFFPTMNIEFTTTNIIYYQNVIKVFATKKLQQYKNGVFNSNTFKSNIDSILTTFDSELSKLFNLTFIELSKGLSVSPKINAYGSEPAPTDGLQPRVEKYEKFKSVNDTWVAGTNYNSDTLFEDFLFVDRANRNIGDKIYVDVFKVKDYLKGVNSNLYSIIESIVLDHHFQPFVIPGYINFYGVNSPSLDAQPQTPGATSFADSLFGTFNTVDYQSTKTKFVCMYVDQTSKQLPNPDIANGYNDDGFDLKRAAQQPLVDKLTDKKDYGLSNKVVGFAVDFGLQNQSVFKNITVSQDLGKPTSESLRVEYDIANLQNGTKTSTQNVSLYNLFKLRSYEASVNTFGNVMIQPMMYFILRNMPLFGGTYLITSVSHTIGIGNFDTSFTGTRMSVFTLPTVDQLLQTIKRELLQNIITQSKTSQNTITPLPNRTQSEISTIAIDNINNQPNPSTANCVLTSATLSDFVITTITTQITPYSEIKIIVSNLINDSERRKLIYTLILLENENDTNGLTSYNYNLGNIPATTDIIGGTNKQFIIDKQYICLEIKNVSQGYFVFEDFEKSIRLLNARFGSIFKRDVVNFSNSEKYAEEFAKCYLKYYPYTTNIDYDTFKTSNANDLKKLQDTIKKYFETNLNSL